MPRGKKEQAEQITPMLREVEVGRGKTVAEAGNETVTQIGVTEQAYFKNRRRSTAASR